MHFLQNLSLSLLIVTTSAAPRRVILPPGAPGSGPPEGAVRRSSNASEPESPDTPDGEFTVKLVRKEVGDDALPKTGPEELARAYAKFGFAPPAPLLDAVKLSKKFQKAEIEKSESAPR